MKLGDFEIEIVSGGELHIDGGAMFGVVPKVIWQRKCPPDDRNRIHMDTNCLLVRAAGQTILVDSGYGTRRPHKMCENYSLTSRPVLIENLASLGIAPDNIDIVILTHLHFDHVGGCTMLDESNNILPTFRRARHIVQQVEWSDATADRPDLAGAYFADDLQPLQAAGLLELVNGEIELLAGIQLQPAGGHTRGHQIVRLESQGASAVFLADLCPLSSHLKAHWTMAYDQYPLWTRTTKPIVLGDIADKNRLAIFEHDPIVRTAYLKRHEREEFVLESS